MSEMTGKPVTLALHKYTSIEMSCPINMFNYYVSVKNTYFIKVMNISGG
jgi:hypothetical protein